MLSNNDSNKSLVQWVPAMKEAEFLGEALVAYQVA
jgi:hypothetical protein